MHAGTDHSLNSRLVVEALRHNGKLQHQTVDQPPHPSLEEEEGGLAAMHPNVGSVSLVKPRIPVVREFQALVRDTFARHAIPEREGLDVGSGASGYMVGKLLPPNAQTNWVQMELNPAAAKLNSEANPGLTVVTGSYLRLVEQHLTNMFKVVTGLSSLDATAHIDHAVEQIRQALKMDGYLLHVQDTRPGLMVAQQELVHLGGTPPFDAIGMNDPNAMPNNTILYRHGLATFDVIELFRRRLERAIRDNGGFELLESKWMTAVGPGDVPGVDKYSELGVHVGLQSPGGRPPRNSASAAITVARRRR